MTAVLSLPEVVPQKDIAASQLELQALQKRQAAVAGSLGEAEALVAPATGVISAMGVVNGQVVEARETLLEIVDPARLSVEALAYDASLVNGIRSASVPLVGGALELQFVGGGQQLREQALPLLFRVKSQNAPVAVGQAVKVIVKTSRTTPGTAVPHAAVARNSAGDNSSSASIAQATADAVNSANTRVLGITPRPMVRKPMTRTMLVVIIAGPACE